jgi:DNA invertase Pin-like site-specific DNA recombinase
VADAGHGVGEVLIDDGKSAWNPRVRRPDWEALMTRLESGESDGVCVYDLSRFARQVDDGERLVKAALRGLVVLDSESDATFDLTSPGGKKAFRDAVNAAAYYSDRTSKTGKRGKALRAREGLSSGGPRAFGFEPDGITVCEDEATVLRDWADRLLRGESVLSLEQEARAQGILTSTGAQWIHSTIRNVMMRERNAGIIVHNGKPVGKMSSAPILDRPTHDRVVALFESRRRGRPVSYVCSGRGFAQCGVCGWPLYGRPRSHHRAYEDGEPKREYWCSPANGGCSGVNIDQRALDEWAAEWAVKILADPKHADQVAERAAELSARRGELDQEASDIEATLGDLNDKLAADLPAAVRAGRRETVLARYAAVTGPLEARLGSIATGLAAIEAESADPSPGRTIPARDQAYLYWLDRWMSGTTGEKRQILAHALGGRVIVVESGRGAERIEVRPAG